MWRNFFELRLQGFEDGLPAMAGVGTTDASGEIDVAVAVDVFEPCVFGFGDVDGRAVGEQAVRMAWARRVWRAWELGPGFSC